MLPLTLMHLTETEHEFLDDLVQSMHETAVYADADIDLMTKAYLVAAGYHRHETRDTNGSQFITHPASIALEMIEKGQDIELVVSSLLHDCAEALLENRKGCYTYPKSARDLAVNEVMHSFFQSLDDRATKRYSRTLNDVKALVRTATRVPDTKFYYSMEDFEELSEENKMRFLLLKCTDRYRNVAETSGVESKYKLKSAFKTLWWTNEAKRFMVERRKLEVRLRLRAQDMWACLASPEGLRGYLSRREQQVATRRRIFQGLESTIYSVYVEANPVLREIIREQENKTDNLKIMSAEEGEELRRRFADFDVVLANYTETKSIRLVTKPGDGFSPDGTLIRWEMLTSDRQRLEAIELGIFTLYHDASIFKLMFRELHRVPGYYVEGADMQSLIRLAAEYNAGNLPKLN